MTTHRRRRRGLAAALAGLLGAGLILSGTAAMAAEPGEPADGAPVATARSPLESPEPTSLVRLHLSGKDALDEVVEAGYDLAGGLERVEDGIEVDAVLTAEELAAVRGLGARVVDSARSGPTMATRADGAAAPHSAGAAEAADTVKIGRVDYFTTKGQGFISVEAKTSKGSDPGAGMTLVWDAGPGTAPGAGGTTVMSRFVDAGVYMYHNVLIPVGARPSLVRVTSSLGGEATANVSDWLYDVTPPSTRKGYRTGFVDHYMNATELYDRIEALAKAYPDLAEIVEMPNKTNGYRRHAQAVLGTVAAQSVVVTSKKWGHEGGNDLTVQLESTGRPGERLAVRVEGKAVVVTLATDSNGSPTSRAVDVVNALNAGTGMPVEATTYRGNAGTGIVAPTGPIALTDFLKAPAGISRDPFAIRAIRIGKHRDGSKPGVLIQAEDHAREWVPPLIALESAERLLRNYATDAETKQIVNNTDIFIVPSNNPDGSHYSFFDYNMQRRNMTNHCGPNQSDPGYRNSWGVDLNRNYGVASSHDGYSGGSASCTSDTYAGPAKLSEPETRNTVWVVDNNPNIKFYMTIHSNGGQLFWQPGAYKDAGRETLPRPQYRDEAYYWQMAGQILSQVKAHRDTVVQPGNVGASADVLYSSSGNVREHLYYTYGIYAFGWEVGGSLWDPERGRWVGGSFQPAWDEAYEEALEYSNGVMEMFKIAMDYGKDHKRPKSELVVDGTSDSGMVEVRFEVDKPATVYYTMDGSRPSFQSSKYRASGIREGGETLLVPRNATVKWFSVDPAGNVENNYDPNGNGENYRAKRLDVLVKGAA
ncbi:M14 family metallopeptidase [Streptosporangium sp. NPDC087985]|uniref:M14 family metallopeptidase n=1 Tax=Streptosporangium sp. NPDC087985 TaxID=3366196 RepID=UPI00381AAA65